jgi:CRISPR-associated protein Cmr6
MVFDRPQRRGNNQPNRNQAPQPNPKNAGENIPSPWLAHPLDSQPQPDSHAGFVEYLRWMRSLDHPDKDIAKLQILQMAEEKANYSDRLLELNRRTQLIAGKNNYFTVNCPWRIRVGGHRGPESILLPAFDALGIPYIPSSTLRGVARDQALISFMQQGINRQAAETEVMKYFGGLDAQNNQDRTGKVIFLDAYPTPQPKNSSGGLAVDITNNIWQWHEDNSLKYQPNPQTFFSLQEPTFCIGIKPTKNCQPDDLAKIKNWLISGLKSGLGSQVNTGYGSLILSNPPLSKDNFLAVNFTLKGQLIHSTQKFKNFNQPYQRNRPDTYTTEEVRCIAFKSMLRYWFRAFAMGVLPIGNTTTLKNYLQAFKENNNTPPPAEVRSLEAILFGGITPPTRGWVKFHISDGKTVPSRRERNHYTCGEQSGNLILSYSPEAPQQQQDAIQKLFTNLTWMMFHLGGVGQGARRPCYSRQERHNPTPPWWRGSTLICENEDNFWDLPETIREFQQLFRKRLQGFYSALKQLTAHNINYQQLLTVSEVTQNQWSEAVDHNCHIIVCTGDSNNNKPYALAVLHEHFKNNINVCGEGATPSPVWIADLEDYQVVTVFGVTQNQNPRYRYLQRLYAGTTRENFAKIFPFPNP